MMRYINLTKFFEENDFFFHILFITLTQWFRRTHARQTGFNGLNKAGQKEMNL